MTGLEKIVSRIAENNEDGCMKMITDAQKAASEMILEARAKAQAESDTIVRQATAEAERIVSTAKSNAESVTRNRYLSVRNAIVNDIIAAAYEEIEKLGDEEYFDLLGHFAVQRFETGECLMRLSAADLARLPEDFETRINEEVFERGAIQVCRDRPADIKNGFILDYGDFEINCSLLSLFDEKMEELRDLLGHMLF